MLDKVLRYIRDQSLLRAGGRVAVAVSGGADSVALLRLLLGLRAELGIVLAVAHFNHELRGDESDADEAFVADLASQHGLEFFVHRSDVRDHAFASKVSLEAAGRELRYQWFAQLAEQQRFDAIATAHTLDDQAETVLLKFLRGAGTRGLAGIYPQLKISDLRGDYDAAGCSSGTRVRVIRPLLSVTRAEVEAYLTSLRQPWREDESNLDPKFLRNRVRHELLPLLEREYNPNVRHSLSDLAALSQAEEDYWASLVQQYLADHTRDNELRLDGFAQLPIALQRRVMKGFAETAAPALDFPHVEKLRRCALGDLCATELPGGRIGACEQGWLKLCVPTRQEPRDYEYFLAIPGEIYIAELELTARALIVAEEFAREMSPDTLLQRSLLAPQLTIRNWRHGDRYRPAHRGAEEKLKRLFADKHIYAEQRHSRPVILCGDEIVWVRDLPVAAAYAWRGEGDAVTIQAGPQRKF